MTDHPDPRVIWLEPNCPHLTGVPVWSENPDDWRCCECPAESVRYVRASLADELEKALAEIANGEGFYGAQAREYKQIARAALAAYRGEKDG